MRIVSLLPSATEILFELGLGDDIVGVTYECDFPDAARTKRIVSTSALPEGLDPAGIDAIVKQRMAAGEDLYRLDRDAFADLDPELVVTQDLCAVCAVDVSEVDDALAYLGCRAEVLTLDPMTLDEVLESILAVGATTDTAGHWVPDLVTAAGGDCVLGRPGQRSEGVEWSTISSSGAEVVLVAPCGFRLDGAARLAETIVGRAVLPPGAEVWAVDADAVVVRPGPRLVDGVELFASILHPDLVGEPDPLGARRVC